MVFGRHAMAGRVALPLDVLRWGLNQALDAQGRPESFVLTSRPPALAFDALFSLIGSNRVQVGASIEVEGVEVGPSLLRISLRLHALEVEALRPESPIAKLLASGLIDLADPAGALNYIPKRPQWILEAEGERFVLDLMKVPSIARIAPLRRCLETLSPHLEIRQVRSEGDWLLFEVKSRSRA